ncbi:hypothetical protein SASPL_100249 [Salvia splendens]|uniref:Uncharacterized protein n=1 Tax=Salvia splendens TaxID=180675 RepID=A0A8X9AA42_SALSN|nr:hypothetical protein SASPL_100249 [Salvia splendens]
MPRATAPHRLFRDLAAAHGPLTHLQLGELHFLLVSSADSARQVTKTHDTAFANRPAMLASEDLAYNSTGIIFSPYGHYWRHLRKICTAELLSARRGLFVSSYDVTARAAVKAKTKERGEMVEILMESIKFMLKDFVDLRTDKSATTIEWAMSELIRNPSKLNKAQQEVRMVFDNKGSYIDEDKFDELKYLKLIVKETLRLHPPVPLLVPRVNSRRCEINGYEIPTNTRVIVNAWALGRDPEYWNDPEKFIPERFEESSIDFNWSNLEYIPFGAGRRMCAGGMLLGQANMELPLALLLYHFD